MHKIVSGSVAALSAAALTLGLAGTAHAELYGIDDPADTGHGSDVLALQVRNGHDDLVVSTFHEGLRKDPRTGSAGRIYVDTDADDRGPEYVLAAGYTEDAGYLLLATEGFAPDQWGDPVEHGDYIMKVRYRKDTVRARISRAALGDPTDVRVAVRVSGKRTDGTRHGLVDWVGPERSFTPWLARG